jgi:hypothetical protein
VDRVNRDFKPSPQGVMMFPRELDAEPERHGALDRQLNSGRGTHISELRLSDDSVEIELVSTNG